MFKFWTIQLPYHFPEDEGVESVPDPIDPENYLDIIGGDDEEEEEIKEDIDEDEDDESGAVPILDKKDDEEEELELTRVNYSELKTALKDNPKLLKSLKNQFFREQEFSRLFPDVQTAENAAQEALLYEDLKTVVLEGNVEKILSDIGEVSKDSLDTFANNFLPTLAKLDKDSYIRVTGPVIQGVLRSALAEGKRLGDENIQNAAQLINALIFGDAEFKAATISQKDPKLERERRDFLISKQTEFFNSVLAVTDKELVNLVGDVDPGGVLKNRPKLKAKIQKEIIDAVKDALQNDASHMRNMNNLVQREIRTGYKGQLKDSVVNTFLSRAKVLIPKIRREIRAEYLGNVKDTDARVKTKADTRDKNISIGAETRRNGTKITKEIARKERMTDMDILNP